MRSFTIRSLRKGSVLDIQAFFDGGEDFVDSAGGVDNGNVEIFGDFGVGGVDFLLESVGLGLESFGGFAASALAFETDLVGNRQNTTVIRADVAVGEGFFGDFDDFAA